MQQPCACRAVSAACYLAWLVLSTRLHNVRSELLLSVTIGALASRVPGVVQGHVTALRTCCVAAPVASCESTDADLCLSSTRRTLLYKA